MNKLEKIAGIAIGTITAAAMSLISICDYMNKRDYEKSKFSIYQPMCEKFKEEASVKAKKDNDTFMLNLLNSSVLGLCKGKTANEIWRDGSILYLYIEKK